MHVVTVTWTVDGPFDNMFYVVVKIQIHLSWKIILKIAYAKLQQFCLGTSKELLVATAHNILMTLSAEGFLPLVAMILLGLKP